MSMPSGGAAAKAAAAHARAMPLTRLLDCGMEQGDARELHERNAAGEHWSAVAEELGDRRLGGAARAAETGHRLSRRRWLRWAAAAFNFAHMPYNGDTDEKRRLYARFDDALAEYASESEGRLERVFVDSPLGVESGWVVRPERPARAVVVAWGGLSGWGATYLRGADALAERGLATILAEGPGQGWTRLTGGIHLDRRFVVGFRAFVDAAVSLTGATTPVGLMGNSFGGLLAAHVAAADSRVAGVVVNGAPADPVVPEPRTPREQFLALTGTDTAEEAAALLPVLRVDPRRHRIAAPLLVLHGGADPLATRDHQAPFVALADGPVLWREWPDGEHTIYNHAEERSAFVADWFADVLGAGRAASSSRSHPQAADHHPEEGADR